MGQSRPLFIFVFSTCHNSNVNNKSIDVVLEIQTWGGRMEGADGSTELWRHPRKCCYDCKNCQYRQYDVNCDYERFTRFSPESINSVLLLIKMMKHTFHFYVWSMPLYCKRYLPTQVHVGRIIRRPATAAAAVEKDSFTSTKKEKVECYQIDFLCWMLNNRKGQSP